LGWFNKTPIPPDNPDVTNSGIQGYSQKVYANPSLLRQFGLSNLYCSHSGAAEGKMAFLPIPLFMFSFNFFALFPDTGKQEDYTKAQLSCL
jgi:hypothetical protein